MNERDMHLNDDMLDRLRAGHFDDTDEAHRARDHLGVCAECQSTFARWNTVVQRFDASREIPPALGRELARRRGAALAGPGAGRPAANRWSYALAGAAAVVAVAVGINMGTRLVGPAEPASVATARAPEFFTEIDFYVWLADRGEDPGQGS